MNFVWSCKKTAEQLREGEWIISNGHFVEVVRVDPDRIITTGEPRMRYGSSYEYAVFSEREQQGAL